MTNQSLLNWASRHGVSVDALRELQQLFIPPVTRRQTRHASEAHVDSLISLEASEKDILWMRNNVGACQDKTGRVIRYGLLNESKQMNEQTKSPDRVGIRRVVVTPDMVGGVIGQFVAREIKHATWTGRTLSPHEQAQLRCLQLFTLYGADASFANGTGTL